MSEKSGKDQFIDGIFQQIAFEDKCKDLRNYEFATWLIVNVWADLEPDDPMAAIISEVIERLKFSDRRKPTIITDPPKQHSVCEDRTTCDHPFCVSMRGRKVEK